MSDISVTLTQPEEIAVTLTEAGNITVTLSQPDDVTVILSQSQGEPGHGVPIGGTTGQVLAKVDSTNFNTEWVDAGSGGGVSESFVIGMAVALS